MEDCIFQWVLGANLEASVLIKLIFQNLQI